VVRLASWPDWVRRQTQRIWNPLFYVRKALKMKELRFCVTLRVTNQK
jgi:hypothetical protein